MRTILYLLSLLLTPVITWDCGYKLGEVYQYHYTSELVTTAPDKPADPSSHYGLILSGVVTLIPLSLQTDSYFIEVYVESVRQVNVDTLYAHVLDNSNFAALFNIGSDQLKIPRHQSNYETNILRAVISSLKVNSCQQTGVFTVEEVTVTGRHSTTYESNAVGNLMFDGGQILYPSDDSIDEWYEESSNIDITRKVGFTKSSQFVGSTVNQHTEFLKGVLQKGSSTEYSYTIGAGSIIESCKMYERYSPRHLPGYSTRTQTSIRTTLDLVSSTIDPDNTYTFSLREIIELKLYGSFLKDVSIITENVVPNLRPDLGFSDSGKRLRSLLNSGYNTHSPEVVKAWLHFVRNIYIGITTVEGRAEYDKILKEENLPWFIDAANINGTAQLHLLAHNAIRTLSALKLTERFIWSKQFTTDPSMRMLKWLLKTCDIDRYEKMCVLAVSSAATNTFLANNGRNFMVNDIYNTVLSKIEESEDEVDKEFFVRVLANIQLPEATQYLVNLAINDGSALIRRSAVETLHMHNPSDISFEDRLKLLDRALFEEQFGGAGLFYVLSSAPHHRLHELVRFVTDRLCGRDHTHGLARFFYKAVVVLSESRADPIRARIIRDEMNGIPGSCQLCSDVTQQSDDIQSVFLFGSSHLGAQLLFERYGGDKVSSGSTVLLLELLENFNISPHVLQTSFDLPADIEQFLNKRAEGLLHVSINGQTTTSVEFKFGEPQEVVSNILLSDVTILLPTLSGLPLSYSLTGSLRTESLITSDSYPLVTLDNRVGLFLEAGFKLAGADLGWKSSSQLTAKYLDISNVEGESTKRFTRVEEFDFKSDTGVPEEWSGLGVFSLPEPLTLLNSSFRTRPLLEVTSQPSCQGLEEPVPLRLRGDDVTEYDPKSYLGQWLQETLPVLDQSIVYELLEYNCYKRAVFGGLEKSGEGGTVYTLQIQALYGVVEAGSHVSVEVLGDYTQRNLQLQGPLAALLEVTRRLTYFPLPGYEGPELLSLTFSRGHSFTTSLNLVMYVTAECY